jgi:hypothetical protein
VSCIIVGAIAMIVKRMIKRVRRYSNRSNAINKMRYCNNALLCFHEWNKCAYAKVKKMPTHTIPTIILPSFETERPNAFDDVLVFEAPATPVVLVTLPLPLPLLLEPLELLAGVALAPVVVVLELGSPV